MRYLSGTLKIYKVRSELGYSYSSVNDELLSSRVYHFQLISFETGKLRCFPEFRNNIIVVQRALLERTWQILTEAYPYWISRRAGDL
jgi:hypothetical protein